MVNKRINKIIAAAAILLIAAAFTAASEESSESLITNTSLARFSLASVIAEGRINSLPFNLIPAESSPAAPQKPLKSQSIPRSFRFGPEKNRFGDAMFTTSLVTLTLLNIADYISTREALKHPGLAEGNPLMKPFVKNAALFAGVKLGMTAMNYFFLKKLYKKNKTMGWVISTVANLAMGYVVANNISKIQGVTGR